MVAEKGMGQVSIQDNTKPDKLWQFAFTLLLLLLADGILMAQDPAGKSPSLEAYRLEEGEQVLLDGRVDEAFWEKVAVADGFRQQEPVEGAAATEPTEVRVAYDRDYLYIGVMLHDSEPAGIKAFQRRRDQSLATDDRFMFILDTYNDQRSAYFFEINPLGLMGDGLLRVGQGIILNKAWDGIWRAWVTRGEYGWSAEIRIPFRTLNFEPDNDSWGINFQRTVRRKNEETVWVGHLRNQGIFRPQNAGQLQGLGGITQGLGLELTPYALAAQSNQLQPDGSRARTFTPNLGGEINYSLTPNLRAGLTLNTDFAETEVDDRQINLSRFPLFFPERRAFFLEGASVFLFAPSSGVDPFFSRRIGLNQGMPVPIQAGARLIGRIEKTELGLLQVRTGADGELPGEHFTAGRVLHNIFNESALGLIYTRRDSDGDSLPTRQTLGTDLELNTSRFLGSKNLQLQLFMVGHTPSDFSDASSFMDRSARGGRLNFPNQPWSGHISYREFGIAYNPAVGFAPRVGFRRLQPTITYSPLLEKSSWIRELSWSYHLEYLMDMAFKPITVNHNIRLLGVRLESGDNFSINLNHNYEYLDRPFDILRDERFVVPPGDYYNPGFGLSFASAPFRRLGVNVSHSQSAFWTGKRQDYNAALFLRPFPGLNLTASWVHSRIRLAEGAFQTQLFRIVSGYDFSPWLSVNFNIQYDNLSRVIGTNNRLSWILKPGTVLYLVYNHNWQEFVDEFRSLESRSILKFSYTLRF